MENFLPGIKRRGDKILAFLSKTLYFLLPGVKTPGFITVPHPRQELFTQASSLGFISIFKFTQEF